jgi:hypothetical protein
MDVDTMSFSRILRGEFKCTDGYVPEYTANVADYSNISRFLGKNNSF